MLIVGDLAYLSGHLPILEDGTMLAGKVGKDRSVEDGCAAARQVGLNMLATLRGGLGSLNSVQRVVKLLGLVNAVSDFSQHPQVLTGVVNCLRMSLARRKELGQEVRWGCPDCLLVRWLKSKEFSRSKSEIKAKVALGCLVFLCLIWLLNPVSSINPHSLCPMVRGQKRNRWRRCNYLSIRRP